MSKLFYFFFIAAAVFGCANCGIFADDFERIQHLMRQKRELKHEIPVGDATLFGKINDAGTAARAGVYGDLYSNKEGTLTGTAFASRDLNLDQSGLGGNLQWAGDRLKGTVEVEKFRNFDPVVTAQGSAILWQPNKDTDLSAYLQGSKDFNRPGRPDFSTGLNFNMRNFG